MFNNSSLNVNVSNCDTADALNFLLLRELGEEMLTDRSANGIGESLKRTLVPNLMHADVLCRVDFVRGQRAFS